MVKTIFNHLESFFILHQFNKINSSVKRDNVEYVIPAEEFTISKVAQNLGLKEKDLKDIKVEVEITKLDKKVVAKYNEEVKANGAKLIFPPVAFEVVAKTIKADGKTRKYQQESKQVRLQRVSYLTKMGPTAMYRLKFSKRKVSGTLN